MQQWLTHLAAHQPDMGGLIMTLGAVLLTIASLLAVFRWAYRDRMSDTDMLLDQMRADLTDFRERLEEAEEAEERYIQRLNNLRMQIDQMERRHRAERLENDHEVARQQNEIIELRAEIARMRAELSEPREVQCG